MDRDVLMFAQVMTIIVMSLAGFVAIGLGTRILWRWGSVKTPAERTPHDDERMNRLETAVDTIAIEVERISEAQRFMVGLLSAPTSSRLPSAEAHRRVDTPH